MNCLTCGIMLYAKWIIGSTQLEDTDQHLSLERFIKLSLTTTGSMLWLTCLMKLSYQGWWLLWTWSPTLPWWRIWEWQWLWTPILYHKACLGLLCVFSRGLLQPGWLHGPVPTLFLHPEMYKRPAFPRRNPLTPNLWQNTPISASSRLWRWWGRPHKSRTRSSHVGWGAGTRQQRIPLHSWDH